MQSHRAVAGCRFACENVRIRLQNIIWNSRRRPTFFYWFFTFFIAKLQHKIINLTKLKEKFNCFLFLVVFLFEKWTQNFQNFWIVVPDFPPLVPPCLYDLSYGRRLDPNTKAFSAAYNDAVDIANKNRLTFLALEYATNSENMRLQCVFSHFQRRKTGLSILQLQLNSIFSLWNLRKIDEIWASSPSIWEIIKTGAVGFATTIRPQSTLASDIKSIK